MLDCQEQNLAAFPEVLLQREYGKGLISENLQPIAWAWVQMKNRKAQENGALEEQTALNRSASMATKVLMERFGKEGSERIWREILTGSEASTGLKVHFARGYLLGFLEVGPGPELHDGVRRRLLAALADVNPLARAGACYGFAECSAREAIPAIEPLLGDLDDVVREAATYAVGKLRGGGQ